MSQFQEMIVTLIPPLRRYARSLARDADRADDLVQDCLARAISRERLWEPDTNLKAWLFTILRNIFLNEIRRSARSPVHDETQMPQASLAVAGSQESRMQMRDLQRAFDGLGEAHKEILMLVVVEGFSYEDAADVLSISVGTVRSRLSRARTELRLQVNGETSPMGKVPQ